MVPQDVDIEQMQNLRKTEEARNDINSRRNSLVKQLDPLTIESPVNPHTIRNIGESEDEPTLKPLVHINTSDHGHHEPESEEEVSTEIDQGDQGGIHNNFT